MAHYDYESSWPSLRKAENRSAHAPAHNNDWGYSHGNSKNITFHAAKMMGLPDYHEVYPDLAARHAKLARHYLERISENRSEEKLYHGFENVKNIAWKPGDTLRLPLTATSGDDSTYGYGQRLDKEDQRGAPTMLEFPVGTPMHGYSRHNDKFTKEFGYRWPEALTAGEFRITGVRQMQSRGWQHDRKTGTAEQPMITVVSVMPHRIFHPDRGWQELHSSIQPLGKSQNTWGVGDLEEPKSYFNPLEHEWVHETPVPVALAGLKPFTDDPARRASCGVTRHGQKGDPQFPRGRPESCDEHVAAIGAAIKGGQPLPPLLLEQTPDGYRVADGNHRVTAAKAQGLTHAPALIMRRKSPIQPLGKSQREKNLRQVASVAAIRDGKILMGLRGDVRKWCCPGGHLEPGETPAKGAVRELLEETGLKAKSLERLGSAIVGKNKNVQVHCYRADVEGEPNADKDPDAEFIEFRWVDPDDLPEEILSALYNKQDATLQLLGAQAKDLDLSKATLAEIMARTQQISQHMRDLAATGPQGLVFPHRMGGSVVVSEDPSKPGRWRATRMLPTGEPLGHVEAEDHLGAIKAAHQYGADVLAVTPFKKTLESWIFDSIRKAEDNLLAQEDPEEPASGVALDMVGFNPIIHPAFAAAKFLSGKPEVGYNEVRAALYHHESYLDAALAAYGLPVDPSGRAALKAVLTIADFTKSMTPEKIPDGKDIEPGTPDAQEAADAIRRAFKTGHVKVAHLDGRHSKGSLIARDIDHDKTLLLKPGFDGPGPAAGAKEDPASQSRREAAFWHFAESWGLGESVPRADLVIIDGKEYAAIHMLPFDWKGLQKRLEIDPAAARKAFAKYRDRGFVHKWAVMDFVLGNPDRHGDNMMISKDGDLLGLIDHGSAFAGHSFDPAYDRSSFVPFYLRAWAPPIDKFNAMSTERKLAFMPQVSQHMKEELRTWLDGLHADFIEGLCHRFGIPPEPQLERLAKVKTLASSMPVDEAINRLWVTT